MSYCINPRCTQRQNPEGADHCLACGTALLLRGRYRILHPLREPDEWEPTEIFEVMDLKPWEPSPGDGLTGHDAAQAPAQYPDQAQDQAPTPTSAGMANAPAGERLAVPVPARPNQVLKVLKKPILLPLFEREATTLQALDHPGIPQVEPDAYFSIQIPGLPRDRPLHCLIMEKIQGSNLDSWLQIHGPINQATALDWLIQLAGLLAQLHGADLFHRDIKLSNIMLRPTGQLALIDFGTVRPLSTTYFAKIASQRDVTSVMSPGYTPLEQINGKAVPQSDFYALGRSFVYLLTGKHPLDLEEDDSSGQLVWREHLTQPLSPSLAQLLDEMMAPFPGQRPLNAQLLQGRLASAALASREEAPGEKLPDAEAGSEQTARPKSAWPRRWAIAANLALLLIQLFVISQWFSARQRARPSTPVSALRQQ